MTDNTISLDGPAYGDEPTDAWGNPVTPWQRDPRLPRTAGDAIRGIGGPSKAQGTR